MVHTGRSTSPCVAKAKSPFGKQGHVPMKERYYRQQLRRVFSIKNDTMDQVKDRWGSPFRVAAGAGRDVIGPGACRQIIFG